MPSLCGLSLSFWEDFHESFECEHLCQKSHNVKAVIRSDNTYVRAVLEMKDVLF